MPHLVILYTPNIERETDLSALCRSLADTMVAVRDEHDRPVFPTGGVRVLAYPAAHAAVADSQHGYGFVYLNLRMARGRSETARNNAGAALTAAVKAHFAPLLARRPLGLTLQIDEGAEVFDAKLGNLHPLFGKS
ncbi:MAG TPA: 5-carboxymethyl-2-hydroxymuconate isomerase [Burkholderiaceae bacterium]|nr:5-carboxymethyl-2-hydroxymuconate isomerase [Burkholderiaceae bacterium]